MILLGGFYKLLLELPPKEIVGLRVIHVLYHTFSQTPQGSTTVRRPEANQTSIKASTLISLLQPSAVQQLVQARLKTTGQGNIPVRLVMPQPSQQHIQLSSQQADNRAADNVVSTSNIVFTLD